MNIIEFICGWLILLGESTLIGTSNKGMFQSDLRELKAESRKQQ